MVGARRRHRVHEALLAVTGHRPTRVASLLAVTRSPAPTGSDAVMVQAFTSSTSERFEDAAERGRA